MHDSAVVQKGIKHESTVLLKYTYKDSFYINSDRGFK